MLCTADSLTLLWLLLSVLLPPLLVVISVALSGPSLPSSELVHDLPGGGLLLMLGRLICRAAGGLAAYPGTVFGFASGIVSIFTFIFTFVLGFVLGFVFTFIFILSFTFTFSSAFVSIISNYHFHFRFCFHFSFCFRRLFSLKRLYYFII